MEIKKAPGFVHNPERRMRKLTGFIVHDTVSDWSDERTLRMVTNGVTQAGGRHIGGPLYNYMVSKDGTIYHTADCRSNNAGKGDINVLKAIQNKTSIPKPSRDTINGNGYFWGIALSRTGREPVPEPMYNSLVWLLAHLCQEHDIEPHGVISHAMWTRRKVDPDGVDMWQLRRDVLAEIKKAPRPVVKAPTAPVQEKTTAATTLATILKSWVEVKDVRTRDNIKLVQRLTGAKVDGLFGPQTRSKALDWANKVLR